MQVQCLMVFDTLVMTRNTSENEDKCRYYQRCKTQT